MNSIDRDNKTLDEIGKAVFQKRANGEEIAMRVVANSDLFVGVLKRINEEPKAVKAGFKLYAATLSSVAVLTIAAIAGVTLLRSSNKELASNPNPSSVPAPQSVPVTAPPDLPPPSVGFEDDSTLRGGASYHSPRVERPVTQNATYMPARADKLPPPNGPATSRDEFYAISGAEAADASGGRIVRVDLPRASLFAMGINVPLENDSDTVKADILIGPDGVTRAIRLVR